MHPRHESARDADLCPSLLASLRFHTPLSWLPQASRVWVVPAEPPLPAARGPGSPCTRRASCPGREMQINPPPHPRLAAFETAKYNPLKK